MKKAAMFLLLVLVSGCALVDPPPPTAFSSAECLGHEAVGMYEHVEYADYQDLDLGPLAMAALADAWEEQHLPRAEEVREFLKLMGFYVMSEATYNHERDHESAAFTTSGSVFDILGKEHYGIYVRARYWKSHPPHLNARYLAHEALHALLYHFGWDSTVDLDGGGHDEPFEGVQLWNEYWLPKDERSWGPGLFEYEFQQKINEYLEADICAE